MHSDGTLPLPLPLMLPLDAWCVNTLSCYCYSVKKVLATVKGKFPFLAMLLHTWYWSMYFLTKCPLFFVNILVSMSNIRLKSVSFVRELNLLITWSIYIRLCFLDVCGLPKN